ncbi:MAG: T9SS type A sorting domain-containing protein [Chitinispirillaceae bacterium]|nr:T9SS type A sorting domain-containing protein [Chitinispirillaceae bacterium]
MKWKNIAWTAGVFSVCIIAGGQPIIVESAPFTFPVEVGVKIPLSNPRTAPYFKYSGPVARAGVLTFSWSFPAQPVNQKGTITVYSLLGRAVKTFPVSTNAGMVAWDVSSRSVKGVYVAQITCGSARHNLKLLLCR